MSDAISLQFRGICLEDFGEIGATGQTVTPVLGVGPVTVTPFVVATDDIAAAQAAVVVGQVYICNATTVRYLRTRMT